MGVIYCMLICVCQDIVSICPNECIVCVGVFVSLHFYIYEGMFYYKDTVPPSSNVHLIKWPLGICHWEHRRGLAGAYSTSQSAQ